MTETTPSAIIFDLDGTVYLSDQLIPGAKQVIADLRANDIEIRFLTNKAIDRRQDYRDKLNDLGIPVSLDDVVNSGWVTARYLSRNYPDRRALVIGEEPLVTELEAAGIETTTDEPASMVVASMDRTFTYEKLDLALKTLTDDTPFVATNPDRTCPVADGEIPDAAGMIAAIEAVTGYSLDAMLGKPSATMAETILADLAVDPEHCLMVGDRPETDIAMGNDAGMQTALVLSGVTDRQDLDQLADQPDAVLESIAEVPSLFDPPQVMTDE